MAFFEESEFANRQS